MTVQGDYVPSSAQWVREQVEAYERSGGQQANTLRDTGLPVIIVTMRGNKSGKVRKIALMRVEHNGEYVSQYVGERGAGELNSQGLLDPVEDALHRRLDAEAHHAPLVRWGPVHGEQWAGLHGLVDVQQGDGLERTHQRPAGTHAPSGLHQPRPPQLSEQPPDDHGVGVGAAGDLLRGSDPVALALVKPDPGQRMGGDRQSAVGAH